MPDFIGPTEVPALVVSGTFPIVPDHPWGRAIAPEVYIHRFRAANTKIEQRFQAAPGVNRFSVRRSQLKRAEYLALRTFWINNKGVVNAFNFNAWNEEGTETTPCTVRFASPELSFDALTRGMVSVGVELVEVPTAGVTHSLAATVTRFPSETLEGQLAEQVQQLIPLVRIRVNDSEVDDIFLSDRRVTIGPQLYLSRLYHWEGIQQSMGGSMDEAQFVFGNADRAMTDLANTVDLQDAWVEFSLFHVNTLTKIDLWAGRIRQWNYDEGPEFRITAGDPLSDLTPYPTKVISRTCSNVYNDGMSCPWAGASNQTHTTRTIGGVQYPRPGVLPGAVYQPDPGVCDKGFHTSNGCLAHGMEGYFDGIEVNPELVRIRDTSQRGKPWTNAVSLVAETSYGKVVPEIFTDTPMLVPGIIVSGRDENTFYSALAIVSAGPIGAFDNGTSSTDLSHRLDGQLWHGYPQTNIGLRWSLGNYPNPDPFTLGEGSPQVYGVERAVGVAFLDIRIGHEKGIQPSRSEQHSVETVISQGLKGWVWSGPGARSEAVLTNPFWIAVNLYLRSLHMHYPQIAAADQEELFDLDSLLEVADRCNQSVPALIGSGNETQFVFRGALRDQKPLRDWLQEVLNTALGYYTFKFGKIRFGQRWQSGSEHLVFTSGNVIMDSVQMESVRAEFNSITINFADKEFNWLNNSVRFYDIDHAIRIGRSGRPRYLPATMNLVGCSTKSQAMRIAITRVREELGGVTKAEQAKLRRTTLRTTVLALASEPGSIARLDDSLMPGGSGEVRVESWRLNSDFSITISGKTTTDSMYDYVSPGYPKPADVAAAPVPEEPPRDYALPPTPVFGLGILATDPTVLQISGLAFPDLTNTRTVRTATFDVLYTEIEAPVTKTLQGAIDSESAQLTIAGSWSPIEGDDYLLIEQELLLVTGIDGSTAMVTRAVVGSIAAGHDAGSTITLLREKPAIAHFPDDFFSTPEAGVWDLGLAMPSTKVVAANCYVTNAIGNSETANVCLTNTIDGGLILAAPAGFVPIAPAQVTNIQVQVLETGVEALTHKPKQHLTATFTPPENWTADYLSVYQEMPVGTRPEPVAAFHPTGPIDFWVDRPVSNANCRLWIVASKNEFYVPLDGAIHPYSEQYTLPAPAAPHANDITNAVCGSLTYSAPDVWGIDHITWTNPTFAQDVEFWYTKLTVQKTDASGNAAPDYEGVERTVREFDTPGKAEDLTIDYWTVPPVESAYRKYRFRLYVVNRRESPNEVATLQNTAWSGQPYAEVEPESPTPKQVTNVQVELLETGVDPITKQPKQKLRVTYTPPAGSWNADYVGVYQEAPIGTLPEAKAAFKLADPKEFWVDRPTADTNAYIYIVASRHDFHVQLNTAIHPRSPQYTLPAPSAPHANDITDAQIGNLTNSAPGIWGIDHVTWTNPAFTQDVEFWYTKLTVQKVDAAGNPAPDYEGVERTVREFDVSGRSEDLTIDYWTIPTADSAYRKYRFRLYVVNRRESPNEQATLQNIAWNGQPYAQVEPQRSTFAVSGISLTILGWESVDDRPKTRLGIKYTPPTSAGFKGVHILGEIPDGSSVSRAAAGTAQAGVSFAAQEFKPLDLGTFPYRNEQYQAVLLVDTPSVDTSCRFYPVAYSEDTENQVVSAEQIDASPSVLITLGPKPPEISGEEFCKVLSSFTVVTPPAQELEGGKYLTYIEAVVGLPSDSRFGGWNMTIRFPDGSENVYDAGQNLSFMSPGLNTPAQIERWEVFGQCYDTIGQTNSIVAGITPSQVVEVGRTGGTMDLGKAIEDSLGPALKILDDALRLQVGPALQVANEALTVKLGEALQLANDAINVQLGPALKTVNNALTVQLGQALDILNNALDVKQGGITAQHISSVNAETITGLIFANQIENIAATQITGLILGNQIQNLNTNQLVGLILSNQIENLSAGKITGPIFASQIQNINASQIAGLILANQIQNITATQITGLLAAAQIGSINATTVTLVGQWQDSHIYQVSASKLIAGTVVATVELLSGKLTLNLNNVTTRIDNSYDGTLNDYVGFRMQNNATAAFSAIAPASFRAQHGSARAQMYASSSLGGIVALANTSGFDTIYLEGQSGNATFVNILTSGYVRVGTLRVSGASIISSGSPASGATHKIPVYNDSGFIVNYVYLYP